MRFSFWSAVTLFVFSIALSQSSAAFPVIDTELHGWQWYQSTILAGFTDGVGTNWSQFRMTSPGNGKDVYARLWKAQGGAPKGVYIVIPGTGANATSGNSSSLASTITEMGYDALVMTDPFSTDFQETFSKDGLIGFPQKDYTETITMIRTGLGFYSNRFGKPARVGLVGYSLGGLYTALAARGGTGLHIDQFIIINPSIDFQYAMDRLDDMMRLRFDDAISVKRIFVDLFDSLRAAHGGFTDANLEKLRYTLPQNVTEDEEIIGATFNISLKDITHNLANTSAFSTYAEKREIEKAASEITFKKYMFIVGQALQKKGYFKGEQLLDLPAQADLRGVLRSIPNLQNVYILDNKDDLLVQGNDLDTLSDIMGDHLTVFDAGGHCGNFWAPTFQKRIKEIVAE